MTLLMCEIKNQVLLVKSEWLLVCCYAV